jgi:hypothetical protein
MSRRLRVSAPPPGQGAFFEWARQVTDALNGLPNFSLSSTTNGPQSLITGDSGEILIDVGSSATTLWFKRHSDGSTSGWSAIDFA